MLKLITAPLGPLTVRVVDDEDRKGPPELCVVLCHGYGAPGTDLVGLARECFSLDNSLVGRVRFVFPEAPHSTDFGGRQWWPIDMMALQQAMAKGDPRLLARELPEGLPAARKQLTATLSALSTSTKLPMSRIVVGGFSQGAMLATDTVLRLEEAPAALAIFSGALVGEDEWTKLMPRRSGLTIVQSHGRHDPILPFQGAVLLRDLWKSAGADVSFVEFAGGHGIDGDVLDVFVKMLRSKL